jgi:gamma-glutamylcyclotransferase (GGCT)/AIG2-like uncharacterized protein YtfP
MNQPEIELVFAYGTLQDEELQRRLFGCALIGSNAFLPGWSLFASAEDGYLFIKPDPPGSVSGSLLALDATALQTADRWEEFPQLYQREKVAVRLEDGTWREAWVYTRRQAEGTPYAGGRMSLLDRQAVLKAAGAAFRSRC